MLSPPLSLLSPSEPEMITFIHHDSHHDHKGIRVNWPCVDICKPMNHSNLLCFVDWGYQRTCHNNTKLPGWVWWQFILSKVTSYPRQWHVFGFWASVHGPHLSSHTESKIAVGKGWWSRWSTCCFFINHCLRYPERLPIPLSLYFEAYRVIFLTVELSSLCEEGLCLL